MKTSQLSLAIVLKCAMKCGGDVSKIAIFLRERFVCAASVLNKIKV